MTVMPCSSVALSSVAGTASETKVVVASAGDSVGQADPVNHVSLFARSDLIRSRPFASANMFNFGSILAEPFSPALGCASSAIWYLRPDFPDSTSRATHPRESPLKAAPPDATKTGQVSASRPQPPG